MIHISPSWRGSFCTIWPDGGIFECTNSQFFEGVHSIEKGWTRDLKKASTLAILSLKEKLTLKCHSRHSKLRNLFKYQILMRLNMFQIMSAKDCQANKVDAAASFWKIIFVFFYFLTDSQLFFSWDHSITSFVQSPSVFGGFQNNFFPSSHHL